MKIVFLDFDGVIAPFDYDGHLKSDPKGYPGSFEWQARVMDPKCIEQLNRIISETGAKVVVSSAWRNGRAIQDLRAILEAAGFKGDIIGKTRHSRGIPECRGNQIKDWIEDSWRLFNLERIESFVILDDYADMGPLELFLVRTDEGIGLTKEDADKAIEILSKPDSLI